MDDVRIYNKALSPSEVLQLFSAPPVSPGLVAHWKLDNNTNDASGNNYNGTNVNGASFTTAAMVGTHALKTNGSNQYVELGSPQLPSGKSPRSISLWAKTGNIASGYRLAVAYGKATNSGAMFIGQNGKDLYGGSYANDVVVKGFWEVGAWHHITLTYDGTTARLYADGIELAATAKNWNLVLDKAYIGRQVNDRENWNGEIDDVRIYNKALSVNEINAIYAASNARLDAISLMDKNAPDNTENIKVYPIPTKDILHVYAPLELNPEYNSLRLSIYNLEGVEILNRRLETGIINDVEISQLRANMYIYTIISGENVVARDKLIKN